MSMESKGANSIIYPGKSSYDLVKGLELLVTDLLTDGLSPTSPLYLPSTGNADQAKQNIADCILELINAYNETLPINVPKIPSGDAAGLPMGEFTDSAS